MSLVVLKIVLLGLCIISAGGAGSNHGQGLPGVKLGIILSTIFGVLAVFL